MRRPGRRRGARRRAGRPLVAPRFIAFEGIDGSGKTTQAALLADALEGRGLGVARTREPGGTLLGERVRQLVLSGEPGHLTLVAEAHLFAAARAQLVERVVRPSLAAGRWVVSDRFLDSSLAYQGAARGLGVDVVLEINATAVGDCLPDLALVVDTPVGAAAWRRSAASDRIEAEGAGFQGRVAAGYRDLAARFPGRIRLVPGDGSIEEVHARVMAAVGPFL
ncbi:MAG TPA: dTMP kinase [Miltoncostaeaceae bacterium]|nr:dTMP kinase [Miltoncostaeaceae bacterium]